MKTKRILFGVLFWISLIFGTINLTSCGEEEPLEEVDNTNCETMSVSVESNFQYSCNGLSEITGSINYQILAYSGSNWITLSSGSFNGPSGLSTSISASDVDQYELGDGGDIEVGFTYSVTCDGATEEMEASIDIVGNDTDCEFYFFNDIVLE